MPDRRVLVTARDPDGHPTHVTNATAWVGEDYDQRVAVLRRGLRPGHTLDTADADRAHRRMRTAKRRYAAALNRFMLGGYDHPGKLADWMP